MTFKQFFSELFGLLTHEELTAMVNNDLKRRQKSTAVNVVRDEVRPKFTISEAGIAFIKHHEEFRAAPYLCPAGVPTIGYGTTFYPNGKRVTLQDEHIEERTAHMYMMMYIDKKILPRLDACICAPINQPMCDALISFAYNAGVEAVITSTLIRKLNTRDYKGACEEFPRWVWATNKKTGEKYKVAGLVTRRGYEQAIFCSDGLFEISFHKS